jgi:hypothetical protein
MIKVFLIDSLPRCQVSLRRFAWSEVNKCSNNWCHNASVIIGEEPWSQDYDGDGRLAGDHTVPKADARWPKVCEHCGYAFTDEDQWQVNRERFFTNPATQEIFTLRKAPPGAMWFATWMEDREKDGDRPNGFWTGPDGRSLMVRLPDGRDWHVDSRANNCDSPCVNCQQPYHTHNKPESPCKKYEDARPHKCWVRHGDVAAGTVHVDKNGVTCGAGGGSIMTPNFHGFLHNGHITNC